MSDEEEQCSSVTGHVKWFDPGRGFGFVVTDQGGPDILLHLNVLKNFGQSTVVAGSAIVVEVAHATRGLQAVAVLSIAPPETALLTGAVLPEFADIDPALLASRPVEPGRVKWFDKPRGFGFANVWGSAEDVFMHIEVLRRSGFTDFATGEAVGLRVIEGKRGRVAVEVVAWDAPPQMTARRGTR